MSTNLDPLEQVDIHGRLMELLKAARPGMNRAALSSTMATRHFHQS
jgi:hypothetical protein